MPGPFVFRGENARHHHLRRGGDRDRTASVHRRVGGTAANAEIQAVVRQERQRRGCKRDVSPEHLRHHRIERCTRKIDEAPAVRFPTAEGRNRGIDVRHRLFDCRSKRHAVAGDAGVSDERNHLRAKRPKIEKKRSETRLRTRRDDDLANDLRRRERAHDRGPDEACAARDKDRQ